MEPNSAEQSRNPNIDLLVPGDLISENEEVIFAIKPSLWTILFLSFRTVVIAGTVILLTFWLGPVLGLGRGSGYIISVCGAAILLRVGFAVLQWVSRSYVLTNRRVIRIRGVFTIDIFQCSLLKLQNTFLVMTLPQRLLNLGNIELTTAGTGGVEAVWRHCKNPLDVHQKLLRAMNRAQNEGAAGL